MISYPLVAAGSGAQTGASNSFTQDQNFGANVRMHGPDPWYDVTHPNFGAKGDGTTDDTAAIQAAINAANGTAPVFMPTGSYKISSALTLIKGTRIYGQYVFGEALTYGTSITQSVAANNIFQLPNTSASSEEASIALQGLALSGGHDHIAAANGAYNVVLRDIFCSTPGRAGIYTCGFNQQWLIENLDCAQGQYGIFCQAVNGTGGHAAQWDKSYARNVYLHGQTISSGAGGNGLYLSVQQGFNLVFDGLILAFCNADAAVLRGGMAEVTFLNVNTESNGYAYSVTQGGPGIVARTTATGNSGQAVVAVGSTTGMVVDATGAIKGSKLTIQGAGANGTDLIANISAINGTNVTLSTNLATSVTSADCTLYVYCDFLTASAEQGNGGPTDITWINASLGGNYTRYGLDGSSIAAPCAVLGGRSVAGTGGGAVAPIYDLAAFISTIGTGVTVRRASSLGNTNERLQNPVLGGGKGTTRAVLPSAPGGDLIASLVDSNLDTTGSFGGFSWRKSDSNRTEFMRLSPAGGMVVTDLQAGGGVIVGALFNGGNTDEALAIQSTAAGGKRWAFVSSATGSGLGGGRATIFDVSDSVGVLGLDPSGYVMVYKQVYPGAEAGGAQISGGLLHSTGIPSNTNGNNNDWCISDNGHLYFKSAGAWVQKV